MYRLVAIDLDGTLLEKNDVIPDEVVDALKILSDSGVIIVLATGRVTKTAMHFRDLISNEVCVIAYNGSVISTPHLCIEMNNIDRETILEIAEYCKKERIFMQFYNDETIVVEHHEKELDRDPELRYVEFKEVSNFADYDVKPSPKVLITEWDDKIDFHIAYLKKHFPKLYITQSNMDLIEIMPLEVNKGNAMDRLCKIYDVPINDTIAIGDSMNDVPMIRVAGIGAAVNNAVPELKSIADIISVEERSYGVLEILKKYFPEKLT